MRCSKYGGGDYPHLARKPQRKIYELIREVCYIGTYRTGQSWYDDVDSEHCS